MTEVILYDSDNVLWKLDTDKVDIPVTYNIADVREPEKAKSAWSKTSTFLGTTNNNKAFKHLYEISGESDFNVNKKIRAVIVQNGINTFFGYARLLNVKRKNNGSNDYNRVSYEVSFFGETADLFKEINGLYLHDLDLSEWNHDYTRANQIAAATGNTVLNSVAGQNSITLGSALSITSFTYNSGYLQCNFSSSHGLSVGDEIYIVKAVNTSNSHYNGFFFVKTVDSSTAVTLYMIYGEDVGTETATAYKVTMLGAGYVYSMIDYGLNFGDDWNVEHLFPSIYVKEYWDKILTGAGYTYDSNFLDSQFFKHLTIPFNSDRFEISNDEVLEREFKASYSADETTVTDTDTGQQYTFSINADIIPDDDSTNGNNDDNGNYYVPTGEYTAPATGYYNFEWNLKAVGQVDAVPMGYSKVYEFKSLVVIIKNNGTTVHTQWYGNLDLTGSVANYQGTSPNLFLTSGDVITFEYQLENSYQLWDGASTYYTASQDLDFTVKQGTFLRCHILDTLIHEGATVEINNAIPREVLQSDFISSIIRMFKLFVQPSVDNSKHLIIEPRDSFYGSTVIDWTSKLAIDKDIEIIPMAELNAKRYIFKYKTDKDAFNQNHEEFYGEVYGTQTVDVDNDFVVGEQIIEPIFSATPLIDYPVGTDRVISSIVKEGTVTQNRISSNIRILYYAIRGTKFSYTWTQNSGSTTLYSYPYAGHLDNVWLPYYDLNFGYPKATYYNYGAWTDNNLYNRFHRQYIEEITDRHSKIITAYLRLKPSDINTLDFAYLIRLDNHLLRLNKIIDYNVNNDGLTKCEFIKVKSGYTWTPTFDSITYGGGLLIGGLLAPVPANGQYFGYSYKQPRVGGNNNWYGGNNRNVTVNGDDNVISYGAKNCTVIGDGNIIGEVENVFVLGDNHTVTRSNTTYVDGVMVSGQGSIEYIDTDTTLNLRVKTAEAIATFNDVDCTNGNIAITLPRVEDLVGVPLHFKKVDSSANTFTLNVSGGFYIDDDTTLVVTDQYDSVMVVSNGIQWEIR